MESNMHTISLQGSWDVLSAASTWALQFYPSSLTLQRKGTHTSLIMQFESVEMANVFTDCLAASSKITYRRLPGPQPDTGPPELLSNEVSRTETTT